MQPDVLGTALFLIAITGMVSVIVALCARYLPSDSELREIESARHRLNR
jgi:hypothetical protein